jgi:hypothetical protein
MAQICISGVLPITPDAPGIARWVKTSAANLRQPRIYLYKLFLMPSNDGVNIQTKSPVYRWNPCNSALYSKPEPRYSLA